MPVPSAAPPGAQHALPDDQLMLAYAGGDTIAFNLLYARHAGALFRFVRRLLGVRLAAEVDEVFQETWERIVAARESSVPQGATWRTWAFTIAHNLAMDRLRSSGRERAYHVRDDDDDEGLDAALVAVGAARNGPAFAALQPLQPPSAEGEAFWRAAGRRLLDCLDALPDEQRAAFLLHHEEDFTLERLAAALDVGFETVRSRLRYGLKKLRGCMGHYLAALEGGA